MSWHPDDSYDAEALSREEAAEVLAPGEVMARLRAATAAAGTRRAWARSHGLDEGMLSRVLAGRIPPPPSVLRSVGVSRAYVAGGAPVSGRCRTADDYAYAAPDPVTVARVLDGYGVEAALERWPSRSLDALHKLGQQGREVLRAQGAYRPSLASRRPIGPEDEERAIALTRELRSAQFAARALGVSEFLVRTLHRKRGLPVPLMPVANR